MIPPDLFIDTHNASRKAPTVWDALDGSLGVDGSMRRAATLRKDLNAADKQLARLMERIVSGREEANAVGIDLGQKLSKPMQAYMDAWVAGDEKERIELVTLEEAPLPPKHDNNS